MLNGPVPECLRLVHGKVLPVPKSWNSRLPTWKPQVTIARNCRFPEVGTPGSQPGNHCLPLQATAGYQRLELMLPNRFPEVGTPGSQPGNHGLPLQATAGYQRLELMLPNLGTIGYHWKEFLVPKGWNWWFPTWELNVTMARNCRFPDLETCGSQRGNQRLPLQGIAGSHRLELMFSKLSGYHCKELRVPKP